MTNLEIPSRAVVRFYNKRGTAEQWIKEGKQAVKMTRLSCHRFRSNQVRLALSLLAYNLGNLWRRLALPQRIEHWSLTSLQQRLVKNRGATGGSMPATTGFCWRKGHLNRRRFGAMLSRIALLPLRRDRKLMAKAAAESVHSGGGVRRGVANSGLESGAISGCAGVGGGPLGVLPMKIAMTVSRISETGVLWCSFQSQNGNSCSQGKYRG